AVYARSRYRSGLIDFLTLLQSEQSLLSARDGLASAESDQALALVQLYVALGGGWQPGAANPTGNPT
ncbi:MAG TPA: TolC family protein, partial [Sphingomicrobium sp.]